jgi:uncharacterized protein (DUF305 family)
MKTVLVLAAAALVGFGSAAVGDSMNMDVAPKGDTGPSSKAFAEAMMKMHMNMDIQYTGDADLDFVNGMMPHHQGAIDMAKVELQYGKDPKLRKLAQNIVAAQESEIAMMKRWKTQKGK